MAKNKDDKGASQEGRRDASGRLLHPHEVDPADQQGEQGGVDLGVAQSEAEVPRDSPEGNDSPEDEKS